MLELTPGAIAAIRKVIAETSDGGVLGFRIAVHGGCDGLHYEMGLEENARAGDAVIRIQDLLLFVDEDSKRWLEGAEVDFCDTPAATGFIFNNPNLCGTCGRRGNCGG